MNKLIGYRDLTKEQRQEASTSLKRLAAKFGLELYDWGGGEYLAPSVGLINGEKEALMFVLEKSDE